MLRDRMARGRRMVCGDEETGSVGTGSLGTIRDCVKYKYSSLSSVPASPRIPRSSLQILNQNLDHYTRLDQHSSFKMVGIKSLVFGVIGLQLVSASAVAEDWPVALLKRQEPGTNAYNCHDNCGTWNLASSELRTLVFGVCITIY